jgi:hypothetical protein
MDGFAGAVGAYTLGTTCPPNVTYMGVATCGQTLTGDTTGAVNTPTHPQSLPRTPARSPALDKGCSIVVVTERCLRAHCDGDLLSVFLDACTSASVYLLRFLTSIDAMLQRNPLQINTGVGWPVAPENWYAFNAPYNGTFVFDSCGSSFDT